MDDISYNHISSLSDFAIGKTIGSFIKHHRVAKNLTQETTATQAGISRSTLGLLEKGETVTLATLIQVLRALDMLHVLEAFQVKKQISPMALAKLQQKERQRASGSKSTTSKKSDW